MQRKCAPERNEEGRQNVLADTDTAVFHDELDGDVRVVLLDLAEVEGDGTCPRGNGSVLFSLSLYTSLTQRKDSGR